MPKDAVGGFIRELLALMPLSAREVLIAGKGDLAEAYRRRNPAARLTGVGPVELTGFDRFVTGDPGRLGTARLAVGRGYDLVVLDGTEDMDAIYQEIYGADIAGTGNGPASPTFSITGDGFVFESGQYVLQPYAVGIIDFEIPASDFGDALAADIFKQNIR